MLSAGCGGEAGAADGVDALLPLEVDPDDGLEPELEDGDEGADEPDVPGELEESTDGPLDGAALDEGAALLPVAGVVPVAEGEPDAALPLLLEPEVPLLPDVPPVLGEAEAPEEGGVLAVLGEALGLVEALGVEALLAEAPPVPLEPELVALPTFCAPAACVSDCRLAWALARFCAALASSSQAFLASPTCWPHLALAMS
ncbi:hypothetical protein SAMN06265795_103302 [Noviherbaspirillum humi]|uniref:Uncharacterized protein n=1 Tax=Noviherbaspirillum humi TaxID=1688639 RepID=A0A239FF20_9BURK|nr:hypothetical protein SAMN06265795_103302 [Noviherbaspirillum humi]